MLKTTNVKPWPHGIITLFRHQTVAANFYVCMYVCIYIYIYIYIGTAKSRSAPSSCLSVLVLSCYTGTGHDGARGSGTLQAVVETFPHS